MCWKGCIIHKMDESCSSVSAGLVSPHKYRNGHSSVCRSVQTQLSGAPPTPCVLSFFSIRLQNVPLGNSGDPVKEKHPNVERNIKVENRIRVSDRHLPFSSTTKHFLK